MRQTKRDLDELKKHLRKGARLMETLRDDMRVELHLAGMEARTKWKALQPRLKEAEALAKQVTVATRGALAGLVPQAPRKRA